MYPSRFYKEKPEEDRKQLYWGAFVLGSAAFHEHRRAGFCLIGRALRELAEDRFKRLERSSKDVPTVHNDSAGVAIFSGAFVAGYEQRATHCGLRGLQVRRRLRA